MDEYTLHYSKFDYASSSPPRDKTKSKYFGVT